MPKYVGSRQVFNQLIAVPGPAQAPKRLSRGRRDRWPVPHATLAPAWGPLGRGPRGRTAYGTRPFVRCSLSRPPAPERTRARKRPSTVAQSQPWWLPPSPVPPSSFCQVQTYPTTYPTSSFVSPHCLQFATKCPQSHLTPSVHGQGAHTPASSSHFCQKAPGFTTLKSPGQAHLLSLRLSPSLGSAHPPWT